MTPRILPVPDDQTAPAVKPLLQDVQRALGMVPNLHRTLARAPAALRAYLDLNRALAGGTLDARLREQIALATAGHNACTYCASAHTLIGKGLGITADEAKHNLSGASREPRVQTALMFALALLDRRGDVSDAELQAVRAAGFSDGDIVEIVAHVGLNVFINTFNVLARTAVDFPLVEIAAAR